MKKIPLKKRASKFDAFEFSKALLGKEEEVKKQKPFDVKRKSKEAEMVIQSIILDHLLLQMSLGKLFIQRTNNTPTYDAARGAYRAMAKGAHKGFPDIFIMKDGRAIFLEVKSNIGDQKKDQVKMQHWLEKQGAEYYIVRSLTAVEKILEA